MQNVNKVLTVLAVGAALCCSSVTAIAGNTVNLKYENKVQATVPQDVKFEHMEATVPIRSMVALPNVAIEGESSGIYNSPVFPQDPALYVGSNQTIRLDNNYQQFQTFNSMPERLTNSDLGVAFVQMAWTRSRRAQPFPSTLRYNDRASYYSLVTESSGEFDRDQPETHQIETVQTGWCAVAAFSDGRFAVLTYPFNPTALLLSINSEIGATDFVTTPIPGTQGGLLPRIAIDGSDNIHIIYTFNPSDPNRGGELVYRRSTDGGQSWENEVVLTGPNAIGEAGEIPNIGALEAYAITAREDAVAIVYVDEDDVAVERRSVDNGASWGEAAAIWGPGFERLNFVADIGNDLVLATTDTTFGVGAHVDCQFDSDLDLHVVTSVVPCARHGAMTFDDFDAGDNLNFVEGRDTLNSWNRLYTALGFFYTREEEGSYQPLMAVGAPNITGLTMLDRANPFLNSGVDLMEGVSISGFPNMGLDADDNIYLAFTSVMANDWENIQLIDQNTGLPTGNTVDVWNRHIFLQTREAGDNTEWGDPIDLTPNGFDCAYSTVADNVGDHVFAGFTCDLVPLDNFGTLGPWSEKFFYFAPISVDNPGPLQVTVDVEENAEAGANNLLMEVSPNPVSGESMVTFFVPKSGMASVELFNSLGTKVMTLHNQFVANGVYRASIDASGLPSGAYYCKLTSNGQSMTQTVNIIR